jgi:uncharacterized protein YhhL (DUF1145 family)
MKSTKWPVAALLMLSPLVGEYLLGSLPVSMLGVLPLMMAMYGAGAIIIRETVRRRGGGWGSIVLLAAAYGLFEEGFVTQSLFNPNYLNLRLLDFGWIPSLGIALPWTLFVISIHVVWSMSVPIALVESAFPAQRDVPWLGKLGLVLYPIVLIVGFGLVGTYSYKQAAFLATPMQLGVVGVLIAALCAVALRLPKRSTTPSTTAPGAIALFLVSLVAGSAFMVVDREGPSLWHWSWPVVFGLLVLIHALFVAFVFARTRDGTWSEGQRFALMAGGFMVYAWKGFGTDVTLHGRGDLLPHTVLAALMCGLLVVVGFRAMKGGRGGLLKSQTPHDPLDSASPNSSHPPR